MTLRSVNHTDSGFELARQIIQNRGEGRPRLIAVTGVASRADIVRKRAFGFEAHFIKRPNVSVLASETTLTPPTCHSPAR